MTDGGKNNLRIVLHGLESNNELQLKSNLVVSMMLVGLINGVKPKARSSDIIRKIRELAGLIYEGLEILCPEWLSQYMEGEMTDEDIIEQFKELEGHATGLFPYMISKKGRLVLRLGNQLRYADGTLHEADFVSSYEEDDDSRQGNVLTKSVFLRSGAEVVFHGDGSSDSFSIDQHRTWDLSGIPESFEADLQKLIEGWKNKLKEFEPIPPFKKDHRDVVVKDGGFVYEHSGDPVENGVIDALGRLLQTQDGKAAIVFQANGESHDLTGGEGSAHAQSSSNQGAGFNIDIEMHYWIVEQDSGDMELTEVTVQDGAFKDGDGNTHTQVWNSDGIPMKVGLNGEPEEDKSRDQNLALQFELARRSDQGDEAEDHFDEEGARELQARLLAAQAEGRYRGTEAARLEQMLVDAGQAEGVRASRRVRHEGGLVTEGDIAEPENDQSITQAVARLGTDSALPDDEQPTLVDAEEEQDEVAGGDTVVNEISSRWEPGNESSLDDIDPAQHKGKTTVQLNKGPGRAELDAEPDHPGGEDQQGDQDEGGGETMTTSTLLRVVKARFIPKEGGGKIPIVDAGFQVEEIDPDRFVVRKNDTNEASLIGISGVCKDNDEVFSDVEQTPHVYAILTPCTDLNDSGSWNIYVLEAVVLSGQVSVQPEPSIVDGAPTETHETEGNETMTEQNPGAGAGEQVDTEAEDLFNLGGGNEPPAGGNEPPAGGNEPPAGGNEPPAGGNEPPAGGNEPPAGGDEPPAGGNEPPAGGNEPPAGGNEPPAGGNEPPAGGDGNQANWPEAIVEYTGDNPRVVIEQVNPAHLRKQDDHGARGFGYNEGQTEWMYNGQEIGARLQLFNGEGDDATALGVAWARNNAGAQRLLPQEDDDDAPGWWARQSNRTKTGLKVVGGLALLALICGGIFKAVSGDKESNEQPQQVAESNWLTTDEARTVRNRVAPGRNNSRTIDPSDLMKGALVLPHLRQNVPNFLTNGNIRTVVQMLPHVADHAKWNEDGRFIRVHYQMQSEHLHRHSNGVDGTSHPVWHQRVGFAGFDWRGNHEGPEAVRVSRVYPRVAPDGYVEFVIEATHSVRYGQALDAARSSGTYLETLPHVIGTWHGTELDEKLPEPGSLK